MRRIIIISILFVNISIAQNITIRGNYSKVFSNNLNNTVTFEGVISLNEKMFDAGVFLGWANLYFDNYSFLFNDDEKMSKEIYGLVLYYYPFNEVGSLYSAINISIKLAKIGRSLKSSGGMFLDTGYYNPNTSDDYSIDLSIGIKSTNNGIGLCGNVGIKYRKYNENISYRDLEYKEYRYTYPQKGFSFFFEFGVQYRL